MNRPILLTKNELLLPIDQAFERLEKIRERKAVNEDSIILEGLFVLAVSSFESSLTDTLRVLLTRIPQKLENKIDAITKEDLIGGNPLKKAIETKINTISYKNVSEVIAYFIKTTAIDENTISGALIEQLQEIKARRNLLIHNNLIINQLYLDTAGNTARANYQREQNSLNITYGPSFKPTRRDQLQITQDYLFESIITLRDILNAIKIQLSQKYAQYTKIKALRELWKFIFPSSVMEFEKVWVINEEYDRIEKYNEGHLKQYDLSSSEEMVLSIWLSHFLGYGLKTDWNFYKLDYDKRDKLAYLLSVIDLLRRQEH